MIELLQQICEALERQEINYMISGSIAMNIYTIPRMTRDIDIVVHLQKNQIPRFVSEFQEGFYCFQPEIETEVARKGMFNLISHKTGYRIDIIVRKDTLFRITEFERRQYSNALGFGMWVVAIEDLIISKLDWIQVYYSDKQAEDISNLLTTDTIDKEYLSYWIKQLNLNTYKLL